MKLETRILRLLGRNPEGLSTYEISKRLRISWSTASLHCYKLLSSDRIIRKRVSRFGRHKDIWIKNGSE